MGTPGRQPVGRDPVHPSALEEEGAVNMRARDRAYLYGGGASPGGQGGPPGGRYSQLFSSSDHWQPATLLQSAGRPEFRHLLLTLQDEVQRSVTHPVDRLFIQM